MAKQSLDWLEAAFDDFGVRLKPALVWKIKSTDLPITFHVSAAKVQRRRSYSTVMTSAER